MTLDIYLIRHGQTETNLRLDSIWGQSNWAELTEYGTIQASLLGFRLKEEGKAFDKWYASPSVRTQQTARHCFEAMGRRDTKLTLDHDLLELSQGDWEGKPYEETYGRPDVISALGGGFLALSEGRHSAWRKPHYGSR